MGERTAALSARAPAGAIQVTFLGTSAGIPTETRGLPSLALSLGGEILLFDCGEGTQIQFRRAGLRPGRLAHILISHLHGDHVLGLPGLLMSLQLGGRTQPLGLHGPPGIGDFIRATLERLAAHVVFPLEITEHSGPERVVRGNGYEVECQPLEHRILCLGYALQEAPRPGALDVAVARRLGVADGPLMGRLKAGESVTTADGRVVTAREVLRPPVPGRRIAYCTDTRPCPTCVALARDADLLIHESTFTSDRAEDAQQKGHSTAAEAAAIAAQAGARRLALTHISPRYQDPEALRADAGCLFPATVVAADLQRLTVPKRVA